MRVQINCFAWIMKTELAYLSKRLLFSIEESNYPSLTSVQLLSRI